MDSNEGADGAPATWCVLVAAGSGTRFGGPKQFAQLGGRSVLEHSVAVALAATDGVVVVAHRDALEQTRALATGATAVVAGGATRSESSRLGVDAVPEDATVILIHDAARPLATADLFQRVIDAVEHGADAAVPVVPLTDTVRDIGGALVDREQLVAAQTPQGFSAGVLRHAVATGEEATDDAALVAAVGGTVAFVDGDPANRKITQPDDLIVAEALLGARDASGVPR